MHLQYSLCSSNQFFLFSYNSIISLDSTNEGIISLFVVHNVQQQHLDENMEKHSSHLIAVYTNSPHLQYINIPPTRILIRRLINLFSAYLYIDCSLKGSSLCLWRFVWSNFQWQIFWLLYTLFILEIYRINVCS